MSSFPISKKTEQKNRNRKFLAQRKSTAKAVQMASQIGFEPTAFRLGGEPSIQLRYWDLRKIMSRPVAEPLPLRRGMLYPLNYGGGFANSILLYPLSGNEPFTT